MTFRCSCASRGIIVSYKFANATSVGETPETHTTVAEHAQTGGLRLSELKLLEQAGLKTLHSQSSEDAKRNENA